MMGISDLSGSVNLAKQGIRQVCDSIVGLRNLPDTVFARLVVFFVSKSATSLHAVEQLWKAGFGADAQVLVRTILEDAINLYYIHKSPQARSEEFVNYEHIEAHRELQALKRTSQKSGISAEREAEIVADYEAHKATYKGRSNWSGKNLEIMAVDCGLSMHYDVVYRYASKLYAWRPEVGSSLLESQRRHFGLQCSCTRCSACRDRNDRSKHIGVDDCGPCMQRLRRSGASDVHGGKGPFLERYLAEWLDRGVKPASRDGSKRSRGRG